MIVQQPFQRLRDLLAQFGITRGHLAELADFGVCPVRGRDVPGGPGYARVSAEDATAVLGEVLRLVGVEAG